MPGITGWSQIKSNDKMSWSKRFDFDLWYIKNQSFFLDLKIIFLTIKNLFLSIFVKNKISHPIKKFNGSN